MQLSPGSSVHAGGPWYNQRDAFTVNFVTLGTAGFAFRRIDVNNRYHLFMDPSTGYVALEKWIGGGEDTPGHFTETVNGGADYPGEARRPGQLFLVGGAGRPSRGRTAP